MRPRMILSIAPLVALLAACDEGSGPDDGIEEGQLAVEPVVSGLTNPVYLTTPEDDDRLFVAEQPGRVRVIDDGQLLTTPFLDISDSVETTGNEQGLLSLAFHPDYASNGFFYVNYTAEPDGATHVERYSVSGNPDVADASSRKLLLSVDQPLRNHNGGLVKFGPDEMLYIGMGDGGGAGDDFGNGQNTGTLLGALLRVDVDTGDPFGIPADNPFVDDPEARDEIWAYGLRNPWRFAFAQGLLYIADVGQNSWEEVNAVEADRAGLNYGWNIMEGAHCFDPPQDCDPSGLIQPVVEYGHGEGCSITGGFVYRGAAIPEIQGSYFYSDFCAGFLRSFRLEGGAVTDERSWDVGDVGMVLSFGEDSAGELYILSANGTVYRLVEAD